MWPQTLQMSEDDCRSTLRRLELETYANVIGVFRAQGGLNDKKANLLEELRSIFHISQDRHRAEARRVANDEHLSTIAKVVSGPNTWQEWSREGRRPYPMLPRVAPQTALGWIANNLASEAAHENSKLPYPAETAAAAMEDQASILAASAAAEANGFRYAEKYVVTSDPFKMPDIPAAGIKKNLKRSMIDAQQSSGTSQSKKRNINDLPALNKQKHSAIVAAGATAATNSRLNRLQQQRFFYQQQQKSKKLAKTVGKREKLQGANKSGRKSKKLKEQLNQQLIQEEQFYQHEFSDRSYENQFSHQHGHADSSTNNIGMIADAAQQQHIEGFIDQKDAQKSFYLPLMIPQIAASKRDITRNLTKLQIPGQAGANSRISGQLDATPVPNQALNSPTVSSQIVVGSKSMADGKLAPLSTPVQKYIVEDRQPPTSGGHHSPSVPTTSICPPTAQASTSQYMNLPHLSTPNKLRALNTTILPPGTKLSASAKKLSGATILSATVVSPGSTSNTQLSESLINNTNATSQLYSLVDGGGSINNNTGASSSSQQQSLPGPSAPTHTPPAVIQLHSNDVVRVGSQQSTAASSTQSKVLTTKILPIVLSGNTSSTSFTKGDSSKNGNTIVSSANFVTNTGTGGSTIIKSLPSSMFVSSQQSGSPGFSAFGSTGPVYRKHPNILKSSSSSLSRNSLTSSGGPQIISNIRLTPAITTATTAVHQTQTGIFQQPLRAGAGSSTSGIRTSVKICQSPNGKVFIQPANVDTSKLTKLPQRILPGTLLGNSSNLGGANVTSSTSGSLSSNQPGSPHRIAIQKVQIIPAPLSGSTLSNTNQQQQRLGTTSLTIGSKGNFSGNIFVPTTGSFRTTKASGAITLTKATFSNTQSDILSASNAGGSLITKQHNEMVSKPSNVVVIDATSTTNKMSHHTKLSNLPTTGNISRQTNLDSNQMITEDTPVDIIVDNSPHMAGESSPVTETSSITAVLASNMLDNAQQSQHKILTTQKQSSPLTSSPTMLPIAVLNATDWEMELDQATAASTTHNQHGGDNTSGQYNQKLHQQQQQHIEQEETAETIIIDDSFEDVIIEEEEQEDSILDNEDYGIQGGEEDMEIEPSDDTEIIMVDNLANIEESSHSAGVRSHSEGVAETTSTKRPTTLNEHDFKSIFPVSEREKFLDNASMGVAFKSNTLGVSRSNVEKNDESTSETIDLDEESEQALISDNRNTESEEILCNNHEEIDDSENQENLENEAISNSDIKGVTTTTEASKTTISASLLSVKDVEDSTGNDEAEVDDEETSTTFDVSKETHSSSKNEGLHACNE